MYLSSLTLSWANNRIWLGSKVTLTIVQSDTSVRHRISAVILKNGIEQTTKWLTTSSSLPSQGVTSKDTITWTPPLSLSQYAVNGKVTIEFRLRMNLAAAGEPGDTKVVDVIDPSSFDPPALTDFTLSDISGNYSKFGAYVAGKSTLRAVISASTVSGASITQYKLAVGSSSVTSTSSTVTLNASQLTATGNVNVIASVTDTYNHTAQKTKQITVLSYKNPSLSGSNAFRYDIATGKEDDESDNIRVQIKGSISNLNNLNSAQIKLEYKRYDQTAWTTKGTYDQGLSWNFTADIQGLDSSYQYDIRISVTDEIGTTSSIIYEVMAATPVMDFLSDGEGLSIGKVATNQGFEVAWPSKFESSATFDGSIVANGSAEFNDKATFDSTSEFNGNAQFDANLNVTGFKAYIGGLRPLLNKSANGYPGIVHADGTDSNWVRTTQQGFIPYQSGGHGSLGTSGWPFSSAYINTARINSLNWTGSGLRGMVWAQLWSGTWSSGSLTLSNLPKYNILVIETDLTTSSMLVGFRDPNGYFVFSGIDENSTHYVIMACSTTASGTKLTINMRPWKMYFNVGWEGVDSKAGSVKRIYGVL